VVDNKEAEEEGSGRKEGRENRRDTGKDDHEVVERVEVKLT